MWFRLYHRHACANQLLLMSAYMSSSDIAWTMSTWNEVVDIFRRKQLEAGMVVCACIMPALEKDHEFKANYDSVSNSPGNREGVGALDENQRNDEATWGAVDKAGS